MNYAKGDRYAQVNGICMLMTCARFTFHRRLTDSLYGSNEPTCVAMTNRLLFLSRYGVHVFSRVLYGVRVFGGAFVHPLQIVVAGPDGFAGTGDASRQARLFGGPDIMRSSLVRDREIWRKGNLVVQI